jgi:hypothetical protein
VNKGEGVSEKGDGMKNIEFREEKKERCDTVR